MKWFSSRTAHVVALAATLLPAGYAQYLPTTVSVAPIAAISYGSSSQQIQLSATVTAASTVNSGTVWFTVLESRVPAAVANSMASAMFTVAGEMPAGSYPVTASYGPYGSIYIANFTKSVTAPVTNGAASASMTVPGGTSPGSYPIAATYMPANGGSPTSYYLTNSRSEPQKGPRAQKECKKSRGASERRNGLGL
jgi:hypothetical protein